MELYEELSDHDNMKLAITKMQVLEEIGSFVKQWSKQITMVNYFICHYFTCTCILIYGAVALKL